MIPLAIQIDVYGVWALIEDDQGRRRWIILYRPARRAA